MKKLLNLYYRHKKLCLLMVGIFVCAVAFIHPDTANAAAEAAKDSGSEIINSINEIFSLMLKVTSAWLWPVIMMTGSLLDNDLIFGGAMGERLLSIWVQIRNLVNVIFVLILLAVAIFNVLPGVGDEAGGLSLGLKTILPRFILALIAVNFSFLAVKVVLDFTNVLTGAVFALPSRIVQTDDLQNRVASIICGTQSDQVPMRALWCENNALNEKAQAFFSRLDRSNITIAYALRFGNTVQMGFMRDGIKDITQLAFNVIFNLVLYVVYAISHIVLFLVLLARIVILWVGVVLSPLIAVGIVMPNFKELADGAGAIKEQFVKNAVAPIKIGLVLSVGYIMLDGFSVESTIHGNILSGATIMAVDPNALPTGIDSLQQLMVAVAMVMIIWIGVFKGAEGTAAAPLTDWLKSTAEGFGKWVGKLPTYAPVIPIGPKGEEKQSMAQLFDTLSYKREQIDRKYGTSPERRFDMSAKVDDLKMANGMDGLSKALDRSMGALSTLAGQRVFANKAQDNKDGKVHDVLEKALAKGDALTAEEFAKITMTANPSGPIAGMFKKKGYNEAKLANAINADTPSESEVAAKESADSKAAAPEIKPDTAASALAGTQTSAALMDANKDILSNFSVETLNEYRKKLNTLDGNLKTLVVKFEGDKIKNDLPYVTAVSSFSAALKNAADNGDVKVAINAAHALTPEDRAAIIAVTQFKQEQLKDFAKRTEPDSAAPASAGSPAPTGR